MVLTLSHYNLVLYDFYLGYIFYFLFFIFCINSQRIKATRNYIPLRYGAMLSTITVLNVIFSFESQSLLLTLLELHVFC